MKLSLKLEAPVYGVVRVWAFVAHLVTPLMRSSKEVLNLILVRWSLYGRYLVGVYHCLL
jgi:hypothetical protein